MIRVSTIIPVYNGASVIARAIDSALAQTFEGQEIIVVNDGSTDATPRVLEGYGRKIKVVTGPNRGAPAARNAGVALAKGEYVAFLDADDEWLSHKLTRQIPFLDADPGCALVYSDVTAVDSEGRTVQDSVVPREYAHSPTFEELLERGASYTVPSSAVVRRFVIELCGGFDESFGRWRGEDCCFFLRAREVGSFHYLPESLVRYQVATHIEHLRKRQHGASINGDSVATGERLGLYFAGEQRLLEFAAERYGEKTSPLARRLMAEKKRLLLSIALLAMHDGDRRLARRAYLWLLRRTPLHPETYARLLWTFLPIRVSRPISRLLPERYRRALMGPPEDGLGF